MTWPEYGTLATLPFASVNWSDVMLHAPTMEASFANAGAANATPMASTTNFIWFFMIVPSVVITGTQGDKLSSAALRCNSRFKRDWEEGGLHQTG
ncbi:hypothetical protein Q1M64_04385 (plasmid) [Sinorhizobium meliloti]|nr:hypothetical protein Q1M64_04385 [Sinorhizobium meliloti]